MIITASIIVLGVIGFVFAGLLALAADYFKVEEDSRIATIMAILPGANCGACGVAGCHDFAMKVINGEIAVSGCVVGGRDVATKIAGIMGVEGQEVHKKTSVLHCGLKESQRKYRAKYNGIKTCSAANLVDGGGHPCKYGCLGYGDCFCVCPFDAIKMVDGLPIINTDKCTACGKCVTACPRNIITIKPYYALRVVIACSSHDTGVNTRKVCPVGCIACKICEKEVPDVFKVVANLAVVDYSKHGIPCDPAVQKCPTKCIVKV